MFLTPRGGRGGNGAFAVLFQLLLLEQSAHFRASARKHPGGKDRQWILATRPTNHRQTKKSSGFHGLKGKNSLRDSPGYLQTSSPLVSDPFLDFLTASCIWRTLSLTASTSTPLASVILFFCGGMYSLHRWGKAIGLLAAVSKDSISRQEHTEWTAWGNLIHNQLVKELDHVAVADLSTLWYLCSTTPLSVFFSCSGLNAEYY